MKKTRAKKFKVRMFYHLQNLFWGVFVGGICPGGCPGVFLSSYRQIPSVGILAHEACAVERLACPKYRVSDHYSVGISGVACLSMQHSVWHVRSRVLGYSKNKCLSIHLKETFSVRFLYLCPSI